MSGEDAPRRPRLGVCYYPEHWPEERWPTDAAMMREVGISVVRIGEFAWSRLEPEPGGLCLDWLARAIDTLQAAGLEVVLGTPTACPPKWLVDRMPEMLAVDREGRPRGFGSRRHYCFSHPGYREESARIVTALAEAFGSHPALVAWQTDNEYGCHDTVLSYSAAALDGFRAWCAARYGTVEALNRAWGNVFWSMAYRAFDEVGLPNLTVTEANPAHELAFRRYASEAVVSFNRRQVEIIRRHSPGRDVLHNFMGGFTGFDHFALSADLDVATWDSYPLGHLERDLRDDDRKRRYLKVGDPDFQAFHHDLYRACGRGRWWVMEQQPGAVNWAPHNPIPAPGAVRLWAQEAFAAGAEVVSFFRWRQAPFGQEQMHEGLLLPDGRPNEAFEVVAALAREFAALGAPDPLSRAPVALVFDYESAGAWEIQPQGRGFRYLDLCLLFYRVLRQLGLAVDVVPATAEAVSGRALVIVPGLFAEDPALAAALGAAGQRVLLGPRSGSKTKEFQIPESLPPGAFRSLIPLTVSRVESLPPFETLGIAEKGAEAHFALWRELVVAPGVDVIDLTEDGEIALAQRGGVAYLAGLPSPAYALDVVERLARDAGLETRRLPADIRVRDRGRHRYVFNYGPEAVVVAELLAGYDTILGDVRLEACGVVVGRRRAGDA
ncbi:MAG: beta-galactosidase [Kiloniellales bacterium]|nr:beta-galactosidase [Kiloniellales bacterium]